jgi:hypothetical protein
MEAKQIESQNVVDGTSDGAQNIVKEGGTVLPPSYSQKVTNEVGIHWLRISFDNKHLNDIAKFISGMWGAPEQDGYGLWSYEHRYIWAAGVSLNYDIDRERSQAVHKSRCTLDCPGSSLDELSVPDIFLLLEFCGFLDGKCTRIDVFFDDYQKTVTYEQLKQAAKRGDYSGLRDFQIRTAYKRTDGGVDMSRCEVSFGKRGQRGNGKYMRWYRKDLESNGEIDCDRWEVEFTQDKAQQVFKILSQSRILDEYVTICGAIIAGCITFIHRNGDKNISRLDRYSWWEQILKILGSEIKIRSQRKKDTLTGKFHYVEKYVAISLACIKKVFYSKDDFWRWIYDVCDDGESRMNDYTKKISEENAHLFAYKWKESGDKHYELSKL